MGSIIYDDDDNDVWDDGCTPSIDVTIDYFTVMWTYWLMMTDLLTYFMTKQNPEMLSHLKKFIPDPISMAQCMNEIKFIKFHNKTCYNNYPSN